MDHSDDLAIESIKKAEIDFQNNTGFENALGEGDIVSSIQNMLMNTDDKGREFLLRYILSQFQGLFSNAVLTEGMYEIVEGKGIGIGETFVDSCIAIDNAVHVFSGHICMFCKLLGRDPSEYVDYQIDDSILEYTLDTNLWERKKKKPYKVLNDKQRVLAIHQLLRIIGVTKSLDKTVICGFIEAVRGGNIGIVNKNNYAYQVLKETKAARETKQLFEDIGLSDKVNWL